LRDLLRAVSSAVSLIAMLVSLAPRANAQVLYWLDTNYGAPTLNQADANGSALSSVALAAGTLPEGLAIDAGGKLYWAEAAWSGAKLNRAAPTLASITPIVTGGSALRGVAVDGVAQRIYWTTSNLVTGAAIRRAALDGSGATTLVSLPAGSNPRGIAVDQLGGKIYWVDFDLNTLYQANLDGTGVTPWVGLPAGSGPYGVAVDPVAQFVYWTEYGTGNLRRSSTLFPGVTTLAFGLANPTYLTVDVAGARLYWAEGAAGSQHVRRSTTSGTGLTTLPCPLTTYGGLAFQPDAAVSVAGPSLPTEFALEPMWPNPGRGPFVVGFQLPRDAQVRLSVLDLQGREIAVLADGILPAGRHQRTWNGRGPGAAAGIYFARLQADGRTWVRRIALIR
jgi:DNA-binding beta-propeller fold protein YncE